MSDPGDLLVIVLSLSFNFAVVLWMLLDAVRRGRGWIRWQVLLYFLTVVVAVPVWLFRRRRWPVTVEVARRQKLKFVAIAAGLVTLGPVLGSVVTTYFFQIVRIEGDTMSPALNDQDRLFVNKAVYRSGDPAIGDVAMLRYPLDPEKSFAKRVIASGGDSVRIADGIVFRNGIRVDEPYVARTNRSHEDWGPEIVPEGTYFVLGDYRNNSLDSRIFGFVPRKHMVGRVAMRWWPLSALCWF